MHININIQACIKIFVKPLMPSCNFYGIKTSKNRCLLAAVIRLDIKCTETRLHGPAVGYYFFYLVF